MNEKWKKVLSLSLVIVVISLSSFSPLSPSSQLSIVWIPSPWMKRLFFV